MRIASVLLLFIPFLGITQNQQPVDSLKLKPAIRHGVLSNGLSYYILNSGNTNDNVMMKLLVNVGFDDEDPDQYGLSHLVEHMGMRSSRNFPEGLREFFVARGLNNGGDINAQTSSTMTQYYLNIHNDSVRLISQGLLALADCAANLSLLKNEVEEERLAVINELTRGNQIGALSQEEFKFRVLNRNGIFRPRGLRDLESVRSASIESVRRFYRDWYHPVYETVVVVGPVDELSIEKEILKYFGGLSNQGARKRSKDETPMSEILSGKNQFFVLNSGKEEHDIEIVLLKKKRALSDYSEGLIDRLFDLMMLNRVTITDNGLFRPTYSISRNEIDSRSKIDAIRVYSHLQSIKEVRPAIESICTELSRIEQHGFSEPEMSAAKRLLKVQLERSAREGAPFVLMNRLTRHVATGEPFRDNEVAIQSDFLDRMELSEINNRMMSWLKEPGNVDIALFVRDRTHPELPTENEVLNMVEKISVKRIPPFRMPSLPSLPIPKTAAQVKHTETLMNDVTRLVLANNVTILLKPLPKENVGVIELAIHGFSSQESFGSYEKECTIEDMMMFTGVGDLNRLDLSKWIAGRCLQGSYIDVEPYFQNAKAGIHGYATMDNAEDLFDLIFACATDLKFDKEAYKKYNREKRTKTTKLRKSTSLLDTIQSIIRIPIGQKTNKDLDVNEIANLMKEYEKQFEDSQHRVFVIAGAFDPEKIIPLAIKYLGALPAIPSIDFKPVTDVTMVGDSVGKTEVRILYKISRSRGVDDEIRLYVVRNILEIALRNRLREKEGGVYSVGAMLRIDDFTRRSFIEVFFEADPFDVDRLVKAVSEEINFLKEGRMDSAVFVNAKETERKRLVQVLNSPDYWIESLANGTDTFSGTDELDFLQSIKSSDIVRAVNKFIDIKSRIVFKLL